MADLFTRGPSANDLFGANTWEDLFGTPQTFQDFDNLFIDVLDLGGTNAIDVSAPAVLGNVTLTNGASVALQGSQVELTGDFFATGLARFRLISDVGFNDPTGQGQVAFGPDITVEVFGSVVEQGTFAVSGTLVFEGPAAIPPTATGLATVRLLGTGSSVEINSYALTGTILVDALAVQTEISVLSLGVLSAGPTGNVIESLGGQVDIELIGSVMGNIQLAGGDDTLVLRTDFTGNIDMGGGNNVVDMFEFTAGSTTGDVIFGDGNDRFEARGQLPGRVDMGGGNDDVVLSQAQVLGDFDLGDGDDTLTNNGSFLAVDVDAGGGNDTVTTGAGSDAVIGGSGNDTISTGGGADRIAAGSGVNTVTGGSGSDVFVFSAMDETTTLTDFNGSVDLLELLGFVQGADLVRFLGTDSSGKTYVDYASGQMRGTADRQVIDITMIEIGGDTQMSIANASDAFVLGAGDPDPNITILFENTDLDELTLGLFDIL